MTKIAFIGGGSVQWTPGLVSDMALTETLSAAELVLHDIDAVALKRMVPVCKRIVKQCNANMQVTATLDRAKALRGTDFVVLCVGIGGLAAMRDDLEIPGKYGIYQAVGDTVGPGGLARGLRHIPFAVEVAHKMEALCPEAWMLNLTNPMTTICRSITRATHIRTVGLCHEVSGFRGYLAGLLRVPVEQVIFEVAGINHLPIITRCSIGGRDGLAMLRDWLSEHDVFEFVDEGELTSVFEVFQDHLAVKLTLFKQLGVLFGAGDRHVAEFFPGFLTDEHGRGRRYGIHLTTVDHREEMARARLNIAENYIPPKTVSAEQLAPLMAALLGGPSGQFVVNVPNQGQIDNLPRDAVVECMAHVDALGVRPLAVGALPPAVHAIVAAHVDRQELIVEAALTGRYELAKFALASDPLVRDPQTVGPMLEELVAANAHSLRTMDAKSVETDRQRLETEIAALGAQSLPDVHPAGEQEIARFSVSRSTIRELLDNDTARAILEKHFPEMIDHPQLAMAADMTLEAVAAYVPKTLTQEKLQSVEAELVQLTF
jgi:alpha-galactosidase/6-phospho-beta-glucosidase family protein